MSVACNIIQRNVSKLLMKSISIMMFTGGGTPNGSGGFKLKNKK